MHVHAERGALVIDGLLASGYCWHCCSPSWTCSRAAGEQGIKRCGRGHAGGLRGACSGCCAAEAGVSSCNSRQPCKSMCQSCLGAWGCVRWCSTGWGLCTRVALRLLHVSHPVGPLLCVTISDRVLVCTAHRVLWQCKAAKRKGQGQTSQHKTQAEQN